MSMSETGRTPWRRFVRAALNFLLVTIPTVVICGLAVEIPLRMAGYGRLEIYEPDTSLYWRLKPNQVGLTKVDRKPFHINAHGTRGPDFQPDKPANTVRIVSLGDSRTFGWGLSDRETYSAVLERLLQRQAGSTRRVEVINAGVNAWSPSQMEAYFRHEGVTYRPDFVVIADGNGWTQFVEGADPSFVRKFMWSIRLKNLLRRFAVYHYVIEVKLENVYQKYRERFIPIDPHNDALYKEQQQQDPDRVFREAFDHICRLALSEGVTPVLLYLPTQIELRQNPSGIFRAKAEIARQLNIPFVDLTPILKNRVDQLYLEADPVHLNVAGNEIIASALAEAMGPLLTTATPTGVVSQLAVPAPRPGGLR
jgi:hypothetical protein